MNSPGVIRAPASPRFEVIIHVDAEALAGEDGATATLDDGSVIPIETAQRISCDAPLVQASVDEEGKVLDIGRRTRAIPPAIRRALRLRDGGCRFPGCTHSAFVDGHHVKHWAHGGETKIGNLVLLCRHHHRLVHEEGFGLAMEDGAPVFTSPKGTRILDAPPRPKLQSENQTDLFSGFLSWLDGEVETPEGPECYPWDLGLCIEVLCQRFGGPLPDSLAA